MAIDHQPLRFEDFPSQRGAIQVSEPQVSEAQPMAELLLADDLRQLARSSMTPGILEGMTFRSVDGGSTRGQAAYLTADPGSRLTIGPTSYVVTVESGTAVGSDGELTQLSQRIEVDLTPVLSGAGDATGHLYICPDGISQDRTRLEPAGEPIPHGTLKMSKEAGPRAVTGSGICLHVPGEPVPRRGIPIASLKGDRSSATLLLSPISAWLTASSVLVGSRTGTGLVITDDTIVANQSLHLLGGVGSRGRQGHVIVGPRQGQNLVLGGTEITARLDQQAAELSLQSNGGELRVGGPLRGPEGEPLTVAGGSDISLGGGGVLMLGNQEGANLILDENEIMAREAGQPTPLLLQWEGGETRFGGPLRGPADGPLNIVSSKDLSLGGHGALMIGPEEAAHLVVDENEIMASAGPKPANLYMQWHGGETHFGGAVCGPDDGPLMITGEQQASLQGDSGALMIGAKDGRSIVFDDQQVMARDGEDPAPLDLQPAGGATRLGGPLELTVDGELVTWLEANEGGRMVSRSDHPPDRTVEQLSDATALVRKLRPSSFCGDGASQRKVLGFDAEQVLEVAPELVRTRDGALGLCLSDFAVLAIAALQEQQLTIDRLERTVATLVGEDG